MFKFTLKGVAIILGVVVVNLAVSAGLVWVASWLARHFGVIA